jgi:hypothetical protein
MNVNPYLFENRLKVSLLDGFEGVEYDEQGRIIVRTAYLKSSEVGGSVRLYFDGNRKEVMTGRRFDPVSGVMLLRPGTVYRVYTNITMSIALPKDVYAEIVPTEEARDVLTILDGRIEEGFEGQLVFTIMPYRRIEMDKHTSIARLLFRSENPMFFDGSVVMDDGYVDDPLNNTPIKDSYDGTGDTLTEERITIPGPSFLPPSDSDDPAPSKSTVSDDSNRGKKTTKPDKKSKSSEGKDSTVKKD